MKALRDEDTVSCSCKIDTPDYQYVGDDDDDQSSTHDDDEQKIQTLIYTLSARDMTTIVQP